MSRTKLSELIAQEWEFFGPILGSDNSPSEEEKQAYRAETVAERRLRVSRELAQRYSGIIQTGPFKGMQLDREPAWGHADQAGMILGTYEPEVIEEIFSPKNLAKRRFVDIGAADGFYAIGGLFSERFEDAYCFETTEIGREAILRGARANHIESGLAVLGHAGPDFHFQVNCPSWRDVFILCDVEGAEFEIFSDDALRAIRGATVIIEIHNWVEAFWEKYQALLARASTHFRLEFLKRVTMSLPDFHELNVMHDDNRALILSEGRPNVMRYLKLCSHEC